MSQNSKWAAWQNLLHKPVEVVKEEPVKASPKVEKTAETLQPVELAPPIVEEIPVQDVTEHELDSVVVKPEIKKIKKSKTEV